MGMGGGHIFVDVTSEWSLPEVNRLLHLPQSVIHGGVKVLKGAEGFSVTLIDDAAEVREAEGAQAADDGAGVGIILEQVSGL